MRWTFGLVQFLTNHWCVVMLQCVAESQIPYATCGHVIPQMTIAQTVINYVSTSVVTSINCQKAIITITITITQCILFKILLMCYKALNNGGPLYLKDLLPVRGVQGYLAKDKAKGL